MTDTSNTTVLSPEDQAKLDQAVADIQKADADLSAGMTAAPQTDGPIPPPQPTPTPPPPVPSSSNWLKYIFWGGLFIVFLFLIAVWGRHPNPNAPEATAPPVEHVAPQAIPPTQVAPEPAKVITARKYYLLTKAADGKLELRTGGTYSWRDKNPANILYGPYAVQHGAIGVDDQGLAVFATDADGKQAQYDYLFGTKLKDQSIADAMKHYAKESKGYNSTQYIKTLTKALEVDENATLGSLSADKKELAMTTLATLDSYLPGKSIIYSDQADFDAHGVK